jgi:hypothetical protein
MVPVRLEAKGSEKRADASGTSTIYSTHGVARCMVPKRRASRQALTVARPPLSPKEGRMLGKLLRRPLKEALLVPRLRPLNVVSSSSVS